MWQVETMEIEQEIYDKGVVVRPVLSRVDSLVAPDFRRCVLDVAAENKALVIIDLINVDFMDSSGLGALIGCFKSTQETGGLVLCNVHKNVHEVLALTHMDRIFEIYDDIDTFLSKKAA